MDPFSALATPFTHNLRFSIALLLFHAAFTHVCLDFAFRSDQQVKAVKVEKKCEKRKKKKKKKAVFIVA